MCVCVCVRVSNRAAKQSQLKSKTRSAFILDSHSDISSRTQFHPVPSQSSGCGDLPARKVASPWPHGLPTSWLAFGGRAPAVLIQT